MAEASVPSTVSPAWPDLRVSPAAVVAVEEEEGEVVRGEECSEGLVGRHSLALERKGRRGGGEEGRRGGGEEGRRGNFS